MKDHLKQILQGVNQSALAQYLVREYLQARLLQVLQDRHAFQNWAFVGGTALRFLYALPRFSEDLDFSLVQSGTDDHFRELLTVAKKSFEAEAYQVSIKIKDHRTVKSAFIRFRGLLYELDLSPLASQTVSIKLEIDTCPPEGAGIATTITRRHVVTHIQHYDQASLFAGKLHAILMRTYAKGRDMYDLMWYLSDKSWPKPNLVLLNNALVQTGWQGPVVTPETWPELVQHRIDQFDWEQILLDVRPFLERPEDQALLTKENMAKLLLQA